MTKPEIKRFLLAETVDDKLKKRATPEATATHHDIVGLYNHINRHGTYTTQGYLPIDLAKQVATALNVTHQGTPIDAHIAKYFGKEPTFEFTLLDSEANTTKHLINKNIFERYWKFTQGSRIEKFGLIDNHIADNGIIVVSYDLFVNRPHLMLATVRPSPHIAIPILGRDVTDDPQYQDRQLAK